MKHDMINGIFRTCNICDKRMYGGVAGYEEHGETYHPDYFLQTPGQNVKFTKKAYWCALDEKWYGARLWMARTITAYGLARES